MFDCLSITDWYYNGDMIFEDMVITILLFKLYYFIASSATSCILFSFVPYH